MPTEEYVNLDLPKPVEIVLKELERLQCSVKELHPLLELLFNPSEEATGLVERLISTLEEISASSQATRDLQVENHRMLADTSRRLEAQELELRTCRHGMTQIRTLLNQFMDPSRG